MVIRALWTPCGASRLDRCHVAAGQNPSSPQRVRMRDPSAHEQPKEKDSSATPSHPQDCTSLGKSDVEGFLVLAIWGISKAGHGLVVLAAWDEFVPKQVTKQPAEKLQLPSLRFSGGTRVLAFSDWKRSSERHHLPGGRGRRGTCARG